MGGRDDDIEFVQEIGVLIERPVIEDVHLDPAEESERRGIEAGQQRELLAEAFSGKAPGDAQPGRVVGERQVLVPQRPRGVHHLSDRPLTV